MLFPTRGSRTIWISSNGRHTPVEKLNPCHLSNIYELLWTEAITIVSDQHDIDKYIRENYTGRYSMDLFERARSFLFEFCLTWPAIFDLANRKNICWADGSINKLIRRKVSFADDFSGLNQTDFSKTQQPQERNGAKVVTDSTGKQYLLFEIE